MFEAFFYFILVLLFSIYAKKKNFLPNYSGDLHQKFLSQKNIPLIGGLNLLFLITLIFFELNFIFVLFCILIYIAGFFSDSKIISSPKKRFIIQLVIISFFVFYFELNIIPLRIEYLDELFVKTDYGLYFSIFCLLILINGSNFIDGLNGLLLGYIFLVMYTLHVNNLFDLIYLTNNLQFFLLVSLIYLLILNFFNFFYLGDSGSYLAGFLIGYLLIDIYNISENLSPYFIIVLLWYPCFEILFSLFRKAHNKISPSTPDNNHLHQLIFFFIQKKIKIRNKTYLNNISSLLINVFNFLIFWIASMNKNLSSYQVSLIILAATTYIIVYMYLSNFKNNLIFYKK